MTIQPFDFILWCPLLYTITNVFRTCYSLQTVPVGKCEMVEEPLLDPSVERHQRFTNLPEINLKLKGFRIVIPSCIRSFNRVDGHSNKNIVDNSDLFTIEASSLLISSLIENPISRLVIDKKFGKLLTGFARSRRGSESKLGYGNTQYKIEIKSLRVWSGCWEDVCKMFPYQDAAKVERDLLEQNPALEWNTYNG